MNRQLRRAELKHREAADPAVAASFAAALEHQRAGRLPEARRLYKQILATHPGHADSLHMLGMVEHQAGRRDEAAKLIRRAITLNGGVAPYYFNLARVLEDGGKLEEAADAYRQAAALSPENADAHANLGMVQQRLGAWPAAAAAFRAALACEPGFAEAHTNLGNVLRDLGQLEEALRHNHRAVALAPDFAAGYVNLGVTLGRLGQGSEAAACYRRAIALQPDLAVAHYNLAQLLLARGDMAAGWAEYEWRWQTPRMSGARRAFTQPQWQGEAASGKTLLIHAEQGLGDTLQFCRYVRLAKARGLRVMLEVQKPLVRLLQDLPGADRVIAQGKSPPRFDLHIPMLSLPRIFKTDIDTIPPPAGLRADAALSAHWRRHLAVNLGQGLKVGLAWAGAPELLADRQRSIPPQLLAPLLGVSGVNFLSLQKSGPAAPAQFLLLDEMAQMEDFAATAALVTNLDLVITVDTAVAHLAAALGRPVWLLDRFDGCWRWLRDRTDSPWYPGMTIFRQPRPGHWASVLEEVADRLRDFAGHQELPESRPD